MSSLLPVYRRRESRTQQPLPHRKTPRQAEIRLGKAGERLHLRILRSRLLSQPGKARRVGGGTSQHLWKPGYRASLKPGGGGTEKRPGKVGKRKWMQRGGRGSSESGSDPGSATAARWRIRTAGCARYLATQAWNVKLQSMLASFPTNFQR